MSDERLLTVRVLVYDEADPPATEDLIPHGAWLAVALDLDLTGRGSTPSAALKDLEDVVYLSLLENGSRPTLRFAAAEVN